MLYIIDNIAPTMMITGGSIQLFKFIQVSFDELIGLDAFECAIAAHTNDKIVADLSEKTGKKIATTSSSFYFTDMMEEDEVLMINHIGKDLRYWWVVPIDSEDKKYELAEDIMVDRQFAAHA